MQPPESGRAAHLAGHEEVGDGEAAAGAREQVHRQTVPACERGEGGGRTGRAGVRDEGMASGKHGGRGEWTRPAPPQRLARHTLLAPARGSPVRCRSGCCPSPSASAAMRRASASAPLKEAQAQERVRCRRPCASSRSSQSSSCAGRQGRGAAGVRPAEGREGGWPRYLTPVLRQLAAAAVPATARGCGRPAARPAAHTWSRYSSAVRRSSGCRGGHGKGRERAAGGA